jgi:hypothetical protein
LEIKTRVREIVTDSGSLKNNSTSRAKSRSFAFLIKYYPAKKWQIKIKVK